VFFVQLLVILSTVNVDLKTVEKYNNDTKINLTFKTNFSSKLVGLKKCTWFKMWKT